MRTRECFVIPSLRMKPKKEKSLIVVSAALPVNIHSMILIITLEQRNFGTTVMTREHYSCVIETS